MKKRISAFLLSVVLCFTMICPAFAAEGEEPQITVEVSGKNIIVSSEEITAENAIVQLTYRTESTKWKGIPGMYFLGKPAVGAVNAIDENGIDEKSGYFIRAEVVYGGRSVYGYWPSNPDEVSVELLPITMKLSESPKTLDAPNVSPAGTYTYTWSITGSKPEGAISVTPEGVLTATAEGTADITVTVLKNGIPVGVATSTVTVEDDTTPTEVTVKVEPSEWTLEEGQTQQLTATVSNTENTGVTWSSDKPDVADVDADGKVTAQKAGEAIITATSVADNSKSASCKVTVTPKSTTGVSVTSVALDKQTLSLAVNEIGTLNATVSPSNATNKNVTWSSSNPSVATVVNGQVKAIAVGTATITVTTEDGNKTAKCEVKVSATGTNVPVTGVTLNKETLSLNVGVSETLVATVAPGNATNKNVTWKSDNPSVATVDETTGKVTAKAVGTATITATTVDGGKTATCEVTVTSTSTPVVPVTGVTLNRSTLPLTVGGTGTLSATVAPTNASNKGVTWKSSNENVASVDATGKVTAKAVGTATITVTTVDGGKTAACTVTVSDSGTTTYPGGSSTVARPGESGGNVASNVSVSAPASVTGGSVTISDPNAKQGSTVTLTVSPRTGYELDHITVKDSAGKEVSLTSRGNGVYAFTMPAGKVSVDYSFNKTSNKPDIVNGKATFDDVPAGAWYEEAVQYAYQHGIMNGIGDNKFSPDTNLTRAMIVQVLYNLEGKPTAPQGDFEDVPADKWYADPINWAASKGIVNGYGDGNFGPEDNITREQLAAILYRYAEFKKYDVSQKGDLSKFSDAASVSEWFTKEMEWAVGAGLIQGTNEGLLMPKSTATRAQVATVMQRFCEDVID